MSNSTIRTFSSFLPLFTHLIARLSHEKSHFCLLTKVTFFNDIRSLWNGWYIFDMISHCRAMIYACGIWGTDIISCLQSKYIIRLAVYHIAQAIYHWKAQRPRQPKRLSGAFFAFGWKFIILWYNLFDKKEFGDQWPLTMRAKCSAFHCCPEPLGVVAAAQLGILNFDKC